MLCSVLKNFFYLCCFMILVNNNIIIKYDIKLHCCIYFSVNLYVDLENKNPHPFHWNGIKFMIYFLN